jgi:hypothetical protein
MNPSNLLKAAEEKMNDILLAYTEQNRHSLELHKHLIDDLRKATTEFLDLRSQFFLRHGRPGAVSPNPGAR